MIHILTMIVAIAVLVLWPLSRERAVRMSSQALAGFVFAAGLVGFVGSLFRPIA